MLDDRPIKVHFDEDMREECAFIVRRHLRELEAGKPAGVGKRTVDMVRKVLKELEEAGT